MRNEARAKDWKWGEGEGKEGNACRQTPRFWKPAFASERSAWLARLVEQCWHVSIKGLFHTERTVWYVTRILIFSGCCLFWSARFALQCKSILFDLFWNVRLFLRLNTGLIYSPKCLLDLNIFCPRMRWFPAMCHAGPSSLVFIFLRDVNSLRWLFTDCSVRRIKKANVRKPVLIVRIHWYFNINAVHVLQNTKKYILGSHTRPLKFISAPLKAKHFIGQLWQLMTASNVCARTQAWQARWAVFKIPGFVFLSSQPPGGTWVFLGWDVPPETPNWHPVLEKISSKIDTPF